MQRNRVRLNLVAAQKIEQAEAYVLLYWDGKVIKTVEATEINNEEDLERFVLNLAKEGNKLLRRLLKHRLERT